MNTRELTFMMLIVFFVTFLGIFVERKMADNVEQKATDRFIFI